MRDVDGYLDLVSAWHRGKPRFAATLRALMQAVADCRAQIAGIPAAFDLDDAIGAQLDVIGQWVGLSRYLDSRIEGVYFAWDTAGLGWEQGTWQGLYDPTEGVVRLDDETYRKLLRVKIAANQWDGTTPGAVAILNGVFEGTDTPDARFYIEDHQDMSMLVGIAGGPPPALFTALLLRGYFPLKPEGVRISYVASSAFGAPVFGWDVSSDYLSGWDVGAWSMPLE